MSTRYIDVVNRAIDESGSNLDTFATDGSDFNAIGLDPLVYKFKTWVKRAWQTIQQEAYDWEFMSEQAVVNLKPGFLFYSPHVINWTADDANPLTIYDTDDTPRVTGQTVTKLQNLTGDWTKTLNYGWVELASSNTAPINFTLKSGGEYFAIQPSIYITFTGTSADLNFTLSVGDIIGAYEVIINGTPLPIQADATSTVIANNTDNGISVVTLSMRNLDNITNFLELMAFQGGGNYEPFIINCFDAVGGTLLDTISSTGTSVLVEQNQIPLPTFPIRVALQGSGVTFSNGGPTVGMAIDTVIVNGTPFDTNTGVVTAVVDTTSVEFELTDSAAYEAIHALIQTAEVWDIVLKNASNTTVVTSLRGTSGESTPISTFSNVNTDFTPFQNFVHSWKSYDWMEEVEDDDFVEDLAEIDQQSFRIVYHEDPTPSTEIKLSYVPWEQFLYQMDNANQPPGQPRLVTEDNTGRWKFYPALDRPYTLLFDYVRNPQIVSAFDDTFKKIPDDLTDIIMWLTILYYGEYNEQPSAQIRAMKHYKDLMFRMQLRFRDKFHFKSAFSFGGWS